MLPIQITLRDIESSEAIEQLIRKKAEKLHQYYDRISSCRVVIETSQKHKHQGKIFNVRIDVTVPGKEFVVNKKHDQDVNVAMRDAFDAMARQLEEHGRKRHGRVKTHNEVLHGHVARMIHEEGYGFIEGIDGNEYYFSVTNVTFPNFAHLTIGDAVEFVTETVSEGRQAQHVIRERQNHHETET